MATARIRDGQGTSGLTIENVSKRFGTVSAVDTINLAVKRGEFLTLLGPSGSGNTTLLMMIAGFLDPSEGEIYLDGRPISGLAPEKRNFGMVFQGYALFPHMTVKGNIAYPLEVRGMARADIAKRVDEMIELVQLQTFADRYPRQLSGGQQQRVALARALSFHPEILLLDEPLGALDKKLRSDVQAQLKDIHQRLGTTFIYVTHDQEEALSMSDRVVIMDHGQVVQVGTPSELYEKPASIFAADFLGKSNFFEASVRSTDGSCLHYEIGGQSLGHRQNPGEPPAGARITLALRPEKLGLAACPKEATDRNLVTGCVRRLTYFGPVLEVLVRSDALGEVAVHLPSWRNEATYTVGQDVWLHWPEDATVAVISKSEKSVATEP